ncbi:MAG TPA: AAA family ATPase, partial [Candidatus Paceibacterota bacterium]|nr:AAA family ATPase [Candidatus Paceibacterota bacterium]
MPHHLLKRLELNGFKSFAGKTTIEFPTGITAIVGPNGSGKSNVIDGIRWLLGERESKNLRGAKAEDLIFAGTPKRPRVGQAQASLYFENSGNFFPSEFSEIVVTRQVSRDGDNKYFINKAEVRLKDLIDFFAKARLGTKGLVVISQGNSDVFIQATPAIRREMLEEMLGLREYQLKKNAAERRLKNTQINIEKVDALMKELAPHLRSLKRQTGRWEKRSTLEQELRESENMFFGSQLRELSGKISEMDKEIASHKNELEVLQKEKESAEGNLKKVEAGQPKERQE